MSVFANYPYKTIMAYSLEMTEEFVSSRLREDIFNYIVDFSHIDEWDHTIVEADKVSQGPIGLDTEFRVVYSMGLRKVPIDYQITEYHPSEKAVLVGKATGFTATDTITLNKHEQGWKITWHAHIELQGAASAIAPLIKNRILKGGKQTIKDLATALEDQESSPSLGTLKMLADKLVLPGVSTFTKFGYSLAKKSWKPVTRSVRGKHMLITGATSGLGLVCAKELAHRGAKLTLVARNADKAKQVAQTIKQETGNNNIAVEIADLVEPAQVVQLADRLLKANKPIDVLINNAGALLNDRQDNCDGLEASFSLLLLGPVILSEKLKPLLAAAGKKDDPARVINVSSGGMYATRISVSNIESTKGNYSGAKSYARAKRGLVLAGEYWAKAWSSDNIVVQNMHPGWAQTPGVENSLPEFNKKMQRALRTPEQGADTIIWLACATEAGKTSGLFWLDREPHSIHLSNKTRETAKARQALFKSLNDYALSYDVTIRLGNDQLS